MLVCTKAEARASGDRYYFTGVACKRGHVAPRFLDGSCTECKALQSQQWYSDKGRAAAKRRKWRAENPERELANSRAWLASNPEKAKASQVRYAEKNPGKRAEICRDWYHRNVESERARSSLYAKNNPEQRAAVARTRRAREVASGGVHTRDDVAAILKMQKGRCAYCRIKFGKYHVDHIMPLARGGSNDRTNLQALCPPCNQTKSAKDPIVFAQSRGMLL